MVTVKGEIEDSEKRASGSVEQGRYHKGGRAVLNVE